MSNYDDMTKIVNRMNALYEPLISSMKAIDMSAITAASRAWSESAASIVALQQPLMNESLMNAVNNMRSVMLSSFPVEAMNLSLSESMQSLLESIRPTIDMINANSAIFKNNYAEMLQGFYDLGYSVSTLAEQAYEEQEEDTSDDFTSDDEIIEALQEQEADPIGFQEKVANWSEKKKKKYYIVIGIIVFIWTNFIAPYFQDNIGKPVVAYTISKVRELPETAGKVIDELMEGIEAYITEDVPYYYKVTYTDENGEEKEGYVAKKNLKVIEEQDEEESSDEQEN